MRITILLIFLSFGAYSQSYYKPSVLFGHNQNEYFVSNTYGGAGNDGHTQANPITVTKLLTINLNAGDKVFFRRGETFEWGDYDISDNNITVGAYGSGTDPILMGSYDATALTWTHTGGNIYSAPITGSLYWVFKDGVAAKWAESAFLTIASQPATNKIISTALIGATSPAAATALVKEYYFDYSKPLTVTAFNSGTGEITLSSALTGTLTNFQFKLYGKSQYLDEVDEWYFDSGGSTLYYKTAGGAPSGNIRVNSKNDAFTINNGVSGFTVSGVNFTQFYNSAINGKSNNNTTITACNINNVKQNGIFLWGNPTGVSVTFNTITKCGQNAMLFGALISPVVSDNLIRTIGRDLTLPIVQVVGSTLSDWEQTAGCGIVFTYDLTNSAYNVVGGTVQRNRISNTRYCGINFTGSLTEVSYNRLDSTMMDMEDGAAIYCVAVPQTPYFSTTVGTIIQKNIITNVAGKYDNNPLSHPVLNSWGIYVDYQCDAIQVKNNTIWESQGGLIKINYGNRNNVITDNIAVGGTYGIQFNQSTATPPGSGSPFNSNVGNTMTGNVIATAFYPVTTQHLQSTAGYNPFTGGSTNNNFFLNSYGDVAGRRLLPTPTTFTLATFRSTYGGDAGSVGFPTTVIKYSGDFARTQEMTVHLNETMGSVSYTIPSGYVDKSGTTAGNNVTIPAYEGIVLLKTATVATNYDFFTGTNGTSISAHTPDIGGAWTLRHGTLTIQSNNIQASVSGNATVTTSNADANVMINANKGTTGSISIILRHNGASGAATENYLWINWVADVIYLMEHTGPSTDVVLATAPQLLTASVNYYVEAQVVGNRVKIKIDNELRIDYTGTTFNSSSVIHGFRQVSTGTATTNTFALSSP